MKVKIILFSTLLITLISCGKIKENREIKFDEYNSQSRFIENLKNNKRQVEIIVIDGDEYLYTWVGLGNGGGVLTLKGEHGDSTKNYKKFILPDSLIKH